MFRMTPAMMLLFSLASWIVFNPSITELKVGYARAARLLDLLEERGIIGPGDGAKPRQILVSPIHDVDGLHFPSDQDDSEK